MHLTRLAISAIFHRKVWFIWLLLALLVPAVFPYMAPVEQDPTLLEPARAQAAWWMAGLAALTWGIFQGASQGEFLARHGIGEYFSSQGVSRLSQLCQIWTACFTALLPVVLAAAATCLLWAMPSAAAEARSWAMLVGQFVLLFLLVFASWLFLAIGLSTRMGLAGGYLLSAGLALYGLHGVGYLKLFFQQAPNPLMETLWTFSPHYHLGDLTRRLVFKLGHMPAPDFLDAAIYLTGLLGLHFITAWLSFQPRRLS